MNRYDIWIYIIVMILMTNLIRIVPVVLIRKRITNRFVRSFLYYVPYVTLAVMTFPAIIEATSSPLTGALAMVIGMIAAWMGMGLFPVAAVCCTVVFAAEWLM